MPVVQARKEDGQEKGVALVTSLFNGELTRKLEQGALDCLASHGIKSMARVYVPGAMEIPLATQALLERKSCDTVVVLGVVVRGETSHYDLVCRSVERGCSHLQLKFNKPVGFGVLTTESCEQAKVRCGGAKGNKGFEATQAVLDMLQILDEIKKVPGFHEFSRKKHTK